MASMMVDVISCDASDRIRCREVRLEAYPEPSLMAEVIPALFNRTRGPLGRAGGLLCGRGMVEVIPAPSNRA